jgi:hypothetical protein
VSSSIAIDKPDAESEDANFEREAANTPYVIVLTLFFYFLVFHSLSNLPLGDKLLFGVHQRFWMQPSVIFFMLSGLGFDYVIGLLHFGSSSYYRDFILKMVNSSIKLIAALGIIYMHYQRNFFISDQHDAYHFKRYASAILEPLPKDALLFVNYDQQWTSIRYLQKCENFRNDVTAINLSMMTYKWFEHKRRLYPNISWPGLYHCNSDSMKNAASVRAKQCFSMFAFLEDNIDSLGGQIFLSGKLSYQDKLMSAKYDWMPYGLASKVVKKDNLPSSQEYSDMNDQTWDIVHRLLNELPDVNKYPEETWEWTIGRDFKDRVAETAAYRLELAIAHEKVDVQPLIDAMYWIETAVLLDGKENVMTSVLKNAGLAHIHLIQNPILSGRQSLELPTNDVFDSVKLLSWPVANDDSWKLWCSQKFLHYWGLFLERPDAQADGQFATIKTMHAKTKEILMPHLSSKSDPVGPVTSTKDSKSDQNANMNMKMKDDVLDSPSADRDQTLEFDVEIGSGDATNVKKSKKKKRRVGST